MWIKIIGGSCGLDWEGFDLIFFSGQMLSAVDF